MNENLDIREVMEDIKEVNTDITDIREVVEAKEIAKARTVDIREVRTEQRTTDIDIKELNNNISLSNNLLFTIIGLLLILIVVLIVRG